MKRLGEILSPGGLWLLGLLVPLVLLYVLKIRRQRLDVSSTWLWEAARRDLLARSPFKRLVAQVPLLLQAAVLVLLAAALARPACRGRAVAGDHLAIVIDTSASMSAVREGGAARIDLARREAARIALSLAPGSDAMVLEAAREPRVVSPLEPDPHRLRDAIERVEPSDAEGDLSGAVALAVDRLRQLGGARRIVVLTDGSLARPEAIQGVGLPVQVILVGEPADNAAIVRFDVRSGADPSSGRDQVQAFALVANLGRRPRDLYVTLRQDGASDVLASRRMLVAPGERSPVVLTFEPTAGDIGKGIVVDLAPRDALATDDAAWAPVPPGRRMKAIVAARERSPWIERALASDPDLDVSRVAPADLGAALRDAPDALVVHDGACPADLGGSDALVVHPPEGTCHGVAVGPAVEHPAITSWAAGDGRLRFLSLDGVHVARANVLGPGATRGELVRTARGAIVADASEPGRAVTIVGFDVGESDWPLKASFVLFVRNVVESARSHRASPATARVRVGEPVRIAAPAGATSVRVVGPGGFERDVAVRAGVAVLADVRRAGLYHASWGGPRAGSTIVAANLLSERESDLGRVPLPAGGTDLGVSEAGHVDNAHQEWAWLLCTLALGFALADVWWMVRRGRGPSRPQGLRPLANPARGAPVGRYPDVATGAADASPKAGG